MISNDINEQNKFDQKLGFGQFRDKRIIDYTNVECDYLLWVLKNVRLPKILWETIIEFLGTKIICNTKICLGDKNDYSLQELEEINKSFKLDISLLLKYRIEPNVKYSCPYCLNDNLGKAFKGVLHEVILCGNCTSELKISNKDLRFFFGWYKG